MKNNFFILVIFIIFSFTTIKSEINEKMIIANEIDKISLKDKIAQMIMIRVDGKYYTENHWKDNNIENLINNYKIGGLITYGGSIHGTFYRLKNFQSLSKIPLFVAADYERGLGTFMDGTLFPTNMALAATGNTNFSYKQGKYIATEAKSLGVNMIFAPVLDINNNLNNPIINIRSYGDTPTTVIKYGLPFIKGIQEHGVLACAKHFPGHGNTSVDSHTTLPIINISKEELIKNELLPFMKACNLGVSCIMTGHIMIPSLDSEMPATFSEKITNNILRKDWEYNGLIITDALEMGALTSLTWHGESAIRAVEGGADIILLPLDCIEAINSIYNAVKSGRISEERINNSFKRIIDYKKEINLFENTTSTWKEVRKNIGKTEHTDTAKEIAQKSITLIKNDNDLIPFISQNYTKVSHIMLSTDNDLRKRLKSFAYDVRYTHGNVNEIYVNDPLTALSEKDILNKVKNSDVILVSMLIRISMNKGLSTIHETHTKLLNELKKINIPIIGISFGSPYIPNYDFFDSYLCTYGYGKVSLDAATNSLFGRREITGKLPVTLNNEYKINHGIQVKKKTKLFISVNDSINFDKPIDIIYNAISDSIFPGAQVFVSKGNEILINKGFGKFTYDENSNKVSKESIYDIASLTKVIATTPVIMKLLQKNRISLDYKLQQFYPEFKFKNKKNITIRHLLTHTSGLPAYVEYYKKENDFTKKQMIQDIVLLDLLCKPDEKVIYSDLGMILLLDIIEKTTRESLDELSSKYFYSPLNMNNTFFNPDSSLFDRIVPTEIDNHFRYRLIKGEVHDENAYILGGVSSHAGLFSSAYDIGIFSKMMLDDGIHLGRRYLKEYLIRKFTKRYNVPIDSERTIGWDTPSRFGASSAGDYFSNNSYGHLGFTGTSLWIDKEKDIIVVILTNRTYPKRQNKKQMYNFRRKFHNSLMKIIGI